MTALQYYQTRTATCLNPFLIFAKVAFRDIWGESRREGLSVVGAHVDLLVLLPAHRDRLAVVVDLPPLLALRSAGVDPGVEENLKKTSSKLKLHILRT